MKCLYCEKDTYFEPYSKSVYLKGDTKSGYNLYRCTNCNAQFCYKEDKLRHIAFFVDIKDKTYYISQYLPTNVDKGSTIVSTNGEKILTVDFIENLQPINVNKKLKFWLTFS